jgi:hypothetical protein
LAILKVNCVSSNIWTINISYRSLFSLIPHNNIRISSPRKNKVIIDEFYTIKPVVMTWTIKSLHFITNRFLLLIIDTDYSISASCAIFEAIFTIGTTKSIISRFSIFKDYFSYVFRCKLVILTSCYMPMKYCAIRVRSKNYICSTKFFIFVTPS